MGTNLLESATRLLSPKFECSGTGKRRPKLTLPQVNLINYKILHTSMFVTYNDHLPNHLHFSLSLSLLEFDDSKKTCLVLSIRRVSTFVYCPIKIGLFFSEIIAIETSKLMGIVLKNYLASVKK